MVIYNSILKKLLTIYSVVVSAVVLIHIIITSILSNQLYYETILMYTLGLLSICIISFIIILFILNSKRTNCLYKILLDECDPLKSSVLSQSYLIDCFNKKGKVIISNILGMSYYRLGEYEESKRIYKTFPNLISSAGVYNHILWNHNKIMNYIVTNDFEEVTKLQNNFIQLKAQYKSKVSFIDEYYISQEKYKSFVSYQYDGLADYYLNELNTTNSKTAKVSYSYILTKIYSVSDKQKSDKYKKYVIKNGNTMFVVKQANDLD